MYASGMKFVNLLKKTKAFANVEIDEQDEFGGGEFEPLDDDENLMASMQKIETQSDTNFKIDEFRKALLETKEGTML